ncbi:MAG: metallophosphoesterase [Clostridia bacterium]|nr:metallophosphoesterase [Clostridia bacterium]
MSVYTIADLHLSIAHPEKSMSVFGKKWDDYEEKLRKNWCAVVDKNDTVIIPGDISWAMTLSDSVADFAFLDALPGQKYIGKGNHDFWWSTANKIHTFWEEHGFSTLHMLYNNAFLIEDRIVCGTRGWFFDEKNQKTVSPTDFEKLCNRESIRLQFSLEEALKIKAEHDDLPIDAFLHFPPIWGDERCENLLDLLVKYGVRRCYFGHIHGFYHPPVVREYEGIPLMLVASDHLGFLPLLCR